MPPYLQSCPKGSNTKTKAGSANLHHVIALLQIKCNWLNKCDITVVKQSRLRINNYYMLNWRDILEHDSKSVLISSSLGELVSASSCSPSAHSSLVVLHLTFMVCMSGKLFISQAPLIRMQSARNPSHQTETLWLGRRLPRPWTNIHTNRL